MLQVGLTIDNRYKILREIGRGGTSCVYLAENIRLHNYWAIKEVYKSGITEVGENSNMLVAESGILTRMRHPGMPSIIDVIDTPQSCLIVMEYIEGISLDKVLANGTPSEKDVLRWGQQLCDVLEYLHSQTPSIIYRDMKPANIMLKPDGNVVLIDFGMAREFKDYSRHDTTYLGTHGYAAPEQCHGDRQTDARTDIYSLGVTLYHLVTGHDPCLPPYGINSICSLNPSLSPDFDRVIQQCTQLQPEMRFQTARELKLALSDISSGERVSVNLDEKPKKIKNKWMWLALIPVALIVLIAVVVGIISNLPDRHSGLWGNDGYGGDAAAPSENVTLYFEQSVYISEPDMRKYYTFTPETSGYYYIYSVSSDTLPIVWVSDADDNLLYKDNTTGEKGDFWVTCWLEEGKTYYLETTLYDLDSSVPATGSYWIYIDYVIE